MIQAFAIMTVIFVNQVPVSAKVMAFFYDRATCETAVLGAIAVCIGF